MNKMTQKTKQLKLCVLLLLFIHGITAYGGSIKLDQASIRMDYYPLDIKDWQWSECWGEQRQYFPRYFEPAGTIHLFLTNESEQPVDITGLTFNGKPIDNVCTKADYAGSVIWHRVNPQTIQPGQMGAIYIRLRSKPTGPIEIGINTSDGQSITKTVTPSDAESLRMAYVGFNSNIDKVYIYVQKFTDAPLEINSISVDNRDMTANSEIINGDFSEGIACVELQLEKPFAYGSYHCIKVNTRQGVATEYQIRARDDKFLRGIISGNTASAWPKFFNTLYVMNGEFPHKSSWWSNLDKRTKDEFTLIRQGYSTNIANVYRDIPGNRIMYTNADEPDAHEPPGLPYMERCGINVMRKVEPVMKFQRANDPNHQTVALIDRTYAPMNWFVYGEVPDIIFQDTYVPTQWHGRDLGVFSPTLDALNAAVGPRPVNMVLWGCMNTGYPMRRSPTPEENDISVHYAIGGGAKGLHYFLDWNSYPTVFEGGYYIGTPRTLMLWKNIGRMNAEIARIDHLLAIGNPFNIVKSDNDELWARALLCGKDNIVVVLVNRNHKIYEHFNNKPKWPHIFPVDNANVTIDLPEWFNLEAAVVVKYDGATPIELSGEGRHRTLTVTNLNTSMLIVLSQDKAIAEKLQVDPAQYAALIESEIPKYVTDGPTIEDVRRDTTIDVAVDAGKTKEVVIDLTHEATLEKAMLIETSGELKLNPGKWLGLFTAKDWHGKSEIIFKVRTDRVLQSATAVLKSHTPNFVACANNTIGISTDGDRYTEDCSFKMKWNGSGNLTAELDTIKSEPFNEFYVKVSMNDPGIVYCGQAGNCAVNVTLLLETAELTGSKHD